MIANPAELRRLIVVQTWGIGDMIMTTPMLSALRRRLPLAEITLIAGAQRVSEVVSVGNRGLCDHVYSIGTGRKRLPRLARILLQLRGRRPDAAFLAVGANSGIAYGLRFITGVPIVCGSSPSRERSGLTHWVPDDLTRHRVWSNDAILRALLPDVESPGSTSFYISPTARKIANKHWEEWGFDGCPVVAFHPGSHPRDGLDKRFPVESCRVVINRLVSTRPDVHVVVLIGPDELELLPEFVKITHPRVRIVTGLSLTVIAAILERTKALVAGDSGLGHIGAAVGTSVLTLFGPTRPERIGPWGNRVAVIRAEVREGLLCRPCYGTQLYGQCPYNVKCMNAISTDEILTELTSTILL